MNRDVGKSIESTLINLNFIYNINRDIISHNKFYKRDFMEFFLHPATKDTPIYDFSFVKVNDYKYKYLK